MDWLSGTDWSQAQRRGQASGPRQSWTKVAQRCRDLVNPQIAMLNRLVGLGKSFKEGKKRRLGLLGSLIGNRFGAHGQNIFNVRDIRSNESTFKQGIGKLLMGKLLWHGKEP